MGGDIVRIWILTLTIFLNACSLPASVSAVSWAIDGASYVATNKTLTDHGLSLLSGKDCALRRFIVRLETSSICQHHRDPDFSALEVANISTLIEKSLPNSAVDEIFYGFDFTLPN